MKKILLIGNGSFKNGGCEAIIRGTMQILSETFGKCEVIDAYFPEEKGNCDADIEGRRSAPIPYPRRGSLRWLVLQVALRVSHAWAAKMLYGYLKPQIEECDVVLSMGGDTYSFDYGVPERLIVLGDYVKQMKKPFVVWGASVGPFSSRPAFEKRIAENFNRTVSLFILREEVSRKYLSQLGVSVPMLVTADPAFAMPASDCSAKLPNQILNDYVCINFSELMARYVTAGDIEKWVEICRDIVEQILKHTALDVVYVPHVKSDTFICDKIRHLVSAPERVICLPLELGAHEMKWVISQAQCNIASRTHSTIASFSSAVPTISLGYSVKAIGLNEMVYGHLRYLIYREDITASRVFEVFHTLMEHREQETEFRLEQAQKLLTMCHKSGMALKDLLES